MKTDLAPIADCFRWILLPVVLFVFGRFVSARPVPQWSRSVLFATVAVAAFTMVLALRNQLKTDAVAKMHAVNAHHMALRAAPARPARAASENQE